MNENLWGRRLNRVSRWWTLINEGFLSHGSTQVSGECEKNHWKQKTLRWSGTSEEPVWRAPPEPLPWWSGKFQIPDLCSFSFNSWEEFKMDYVNPQLRWKRVILAEFFFPMDTGPINKDISMIWESHLWILNWKILTLKLTMKEISNKFDGTKYSRDPSYRKALSSE